MRPETRAVVQSSLREIKSAGAEIQRLQDVTRAEIDQIAKKYSGETSSFLSAVVGGIGGSTVGVIVPGTMTLVAGPAGALLGAALAVLMWRGRAHWKLERATERLTLALDKIRSEMGKLPESAPDEIRDKLWHNYGELMDAYSLVATSVIQSQAGSSARYLLPPTQPMAIIPPDTDAQSEQQGGAESKESRANSKSKLTTDA